MATGRRRLGTNHLFNTNDRLTVKISGNFIHHENQVYLDKEYPIRKASRDESKADDKKSNVSCNKYNVMFFDVDFDRQPNESNTRAIWRNGTSYHIRKLTLYEVVIML